MMKLQFSDSGSVYDCCLKVFRHFVFFLKKLVGICCSLFRHFDPFNSGNGMHLGKKRQIGETFCVRSRR